MQPSTKRKIAKEIVILFSCVLVIGLTWTYFWIVNNGNINKSESLQKRIEILDHDIDSIKLSFPKAKTFDELFTDNLPDGFYEPLDSKLQKLPTGFTLIRNLRKYDPLEILGNDFENSTRTDNIRKLYQLLDNSHYPFSVSPYNKYEMSVFPNFQKDIVQELEIVPSNDLPDSLKNNINLKEIDSIAIDSIASKPQLNKIYSFLKEKKYLTVAFDEFALAIEELPLPPPHSTWTTYQSNNTKKEELKSELNTTHSKIYSSSRLTDIAKWISIIVLSIVYPLRALTSLLIWAFKTLREK